MTWRDFAACARPNTRTLPWLAPHLATRSQLARMVDLCLSCPVLKACEKEMHEHHDYIGVRAGVVHTVGNGDVSRQHTRKSVLECKWCGAVLPADGNPRNVRYCSAGCRNRAKREQSRLSEERRRARRRREALWT